MTRVLSLIAIVLLTCGAAAAQAAAPNENAAITKTALITLKAGMKATQRAWKVRSILNSLSE